MTEIVRTDDVVSARRLRKITGERGRLDAVIKVCEGEWQRQDDGSYRFWKDKRLVDDEASTVERVREQIAKAVEQSAFYYSGTCATKLVPSASGEAATHVVAAYIRSLVLSEDEQSADLTGD